jgi:glycerol-3-phosphate dehydrogenase
MTKDFDVIVLGAGINGCGIARDLSLRGLKVALIERHDIAHGASSNNTGMIHGGIRYLQYDVATTKESCTDAGYIERIAPHLLMRIPFLFPVFSGEPVARLLLEGVETFFEAYDYYQPLKGGKKHCRLSRNEILNLEPGLREDVIGGVTLDEWGVDAFRLTLLNAIDAHENGTDVRTYHEVVDFVQNASGAVVGVKLFDRRSKTMNELHAPITINATGAWGPRVAAKLGIPYRLRQGKGVHVVFSHRVSNLGLIIKGVDGRQMFFLPHQNHTVIGTTDDDYYSDLDAPLVLEDEVKYILQAARHVFAGIDKHRPSYTYVGVRPTLFGWGKNEDALSREHAFIEHQIDGVDGLISIMGGKLAAYRILSEEVSDVVAKRLGNQAKCVTHERPLPGGAHLDEPKTLSELVLKRRYGQRAIAVQKLGTETVCICENVSDGAVRYAKQQEFANCLLDVCKRTGLGLGACGGLHCLHTASTVFMEGANVAVSNRFAELKDAMDTRFKARNMVLTGANLQTEELSRAKHYLTGGLHRLMSEAAGKKNIQFTPFSFSPAQSQLTLSKENN